MQYRGYTGVHYSNRATAGFNVYTDATFGICKNEVCLVGVWVGKRCDGTVIVGPVTRM